MRLYKVECANLVDIDTEECIIVSISDLSHIELAEVQKRLLIEKGIYFYNSSTGYYIDIDFIGVSSNKYYQRCKTDIVSNLRNGVICDILE